MSSIQGPQWQSAQNGSLQSKHEKCRNITEEIYKRINITFEIKRLENEELSDVSVRSVEIDSNELSNGTDLFACDKSDSIPSSAEGGEGAAEGARGARATVTNYININNNEEKKRPVYKRPKKKFRKRVKKHPIRPARSDGSSDDEAVPLSRMAGSPERACTVPNIIIVTKGLTPKILTPDKKSSKKYLKQKLSKRTVASTESPSAPRDKVEDSATDSQKTTDNKEETIEKTKEKKAGEKKSKETNLKAEVKSCTVCEQMFKNERGLRRHIAMSHITDQETTRLEREVKPA